MSTELHISARETYCREYESTLTTKFMAQQRRYRWKLHVGRYGKVLDYCAASPALWLGNNWKLHWLEGTVIRDFLYLVFHQKSPRNPLLHGLKPVRIRYSLNLRRYFNTKPITRCDPRRRFVICCAVCSPPPPKEVHVRKKALTFVFHTRIG